jgi:hypothetical protein
MCISTSSRGRGSQNVLDEKLLPPSHPHITPFHPSTPRQEEARDPPSEEPSESYPSSSTRRVDNLLDDFLVVDTSHILLALHVAVEQRSCVVGGTNGAFLEVVVLGVERLVVKVVVAVRSVLRDEGESGRRVLRREPSVVVGESWRVEGEVGRVGVVGDVGTGVAEDSILVALVLLDVLCSQVVLELAEGSIAEEDLLVLSVSTSRERRKEKMRLTLVFPTAISCSDHPINSFALIALSLKTYGRRICAASWYGGMLWYLSHHSPCSTLTLHSPCNLFAISGSPSVLIWCLSSFALTWLGSCASLGRRQKMCHDLVPARVERRRVTELSNCLMIVGASLCATLTSVSSPPRRPPVLRVEG